jgi:hypothetical protein
MKFDGARAAERVQELGDPRFALPDGAGARNAADWLAARFSGAGLKTTNQDLIESRFPDLVAARAGWAGLAVVLLVGIIPGFRPRPLDAPGAFGLFVLAYALLVRGIAVGLGRSRIAASWRPRTGTRDVLGRRAATASAPARVIFVAHLAAPDRRLPGELRGAIAVGCLIAVVLAFPHPRLGYPRTLSPLILAAVELVGIALLAREPFRGRPAFDHRPGLALLAGLAEGWSSRAEGKVEAWFFAAGANTLNLRRRLGRVTSSSMVDLEHRVGSQSRAIPTLLIKLFDPGLGHALLVGGRGESLSMAETAARDHGVPYHGFTANRSATAHGPAWEGVESISLLSDFLGLSGSQSDSVRLNPQLHTASAQLALEIALRWGKQHAAQPSESLARSSQKPG